MGIFTSTPRSVTTKRSGGKSETRHYDKSGSVSRIQRHDGKGKTDEHNPGHGIFGTFVGSKKK